MRRLIFRGGACYVIPSNASSMRRSSHVPTRIYYLSCMRLMLGV